jgi:hypothetical protein
VRGRTRDWWAEWNTRSSARTIREYFADLDLDPVFRKQSQTMTYTSKTCVAVVAVLLCQVESITASPHTGECSFPTAGCVLHPWTLSNDEPYSARASPAPFLYFSMNVPLSLSLSALVSEAIGIQLTYPRCT